jgi:hypothetical protein
MASLFAAEPAYKHDLSDVIYLPVAAAQTFIAGALVVFTYAGAGTLTECGANPAAITGMALAPASVGLAPAGSIYGGTNIPVLILQPDMILKISSTTTPAIATHLGIAYGITKGTNYWQLDISKTGANARFTVVGISPAPGVQHLSISLSSSCRRLMCLPAF